MQHTESERHRTHCLGYHSYLTLKSHDLSDAVALDSGDSIALVSKKFAVSLKGRLAHQELSLDGDAVMGDRSKKRSDSKESESELSTFIIEMENAPTND